MSHGPLYYRANGYIHKVNGILYKHHQIRYAYEPALVHYNKVAVDPRVYDSIFGEGQFLYELKRVGYKKASDGLYYHAYDTQKAFKPKAYCWTAIDRVDYESVFGPHTYHSQKLDNAMDPIVQVKWGGSSWEKSEPNGDDEEDDRDSTAKSGPTIEKASMIMIGIILLMMLYQLYTMLH